MVAPPPKNGGENPNSSRIAFRFANTGVEDRHIELVVEHERAHPDNTFTLAEAVDAAVSLLKSIGIPRKLVVDDLGRCVLQVQALRDAVRCDQHGGLGVGEASKDLRVAGLPTARRRS